MPTPTVGNLSQRHEGKLTSASASAEVKLFLPSASDRRFQIGPQTARTLCDGSVPDGLQLMQEDAEQAVPVGVGHGARLASAVMFVSELELSVAFYRQVLGMEVTIRRTSAALLVNADGFQLYLRKINKRAQHAVGGIGVQYVIWTAADNEDLRRCEQFLKDQSAHVRTQSADNFSLVEGRDPNGVPFVITYPGRTRR